MFPPPELPLPGQLLLITDELPSPADFLLHRFLISRLKNTNDTRCIILSVSGDLARLKAIVAKSNINLSQSITSGSVIFVDVSNTVDPTSSGTTPMRPLYDLICEKLSSDPQRETLVFLDDISSLEWIGLPTFDLVQFSRALRALCVKSNASLVILHHILTPSEPDDIFRHLLQMCSYHLDVRPLSSGKSGSISGEIALHAGPAGPDPEIKTIPRSIAIQYKLTDTGPTFFERGTGVL